MISVTVKLFPPLRENRFSQETIEIDEPATVTSLLEHLGIELRKVEGIYINAKEAGFNHSLVDGDKVTFMPMIGGG